MPQAALQTVLSLPRRQEGQPPILSQLGSSQNPEVCNLAVTVNKADQAYGLTVCWMPFCVPHTYRLISSSQQAFKVGISTPILQMRKLRWLSSLPRAPQLVEPGCAPTLRTSAHGLPEAGRISCSTSDGFSFQCMGVFCNDPHPTKLMAVWCSEKPQESGRPQFRFQLHTVLAI